MVVVAAAGAPEGYQEQIAAVAAPGTRIAATLPELEEALADVEPSDTLLVVDPRWFSPLDLDLRALVSQSPRGADPRWATHLVAFGGADAEGTREYAEFDGDGRVRRIQRYYDQVTWPFISGVTASLVPASSLRAAELVATPLVELRSRLAARGVPGRDLPTSGPAFDLGDEQGLLALSERFVGVNAVGPSRSDLVLLGGGQVVHSTARLVGPVQNDVVLEEHAVVLGPALLGAGSRIGPGARLVGPVIVQKDVVVEENAVVLGPALLGAGSRIGRGAVVAHSLVGPGCVVPEQGKVNHRALLHDDGRPSASVPVLSAAMLALPPVEDVPETPHVRHMRVKRVVDTLVAYFRYMRVKRVVDTLVATALLVLLLPLMLLIALLIFVESPRGPVLYAQDREGWRGRRFRCWKFRTMQVAAESQERELRAQSLVDGPQFKLARDPRLTRMGRLLRAYSLDELPQILNVIRGEMAIVGPRPSPFRENQLCVDWRKGRLSVRPGITGLWQVCRHNREAGDFHQWIEYDLIYVRQMSPRLDFWILVWTLLTLGGRRSVERSRVLPEPWSQKWHRLSGRWRRLLGKRRP
jgi:lipopolysaccharide/colanic/teichoic acid biosynthesis glycosyltransferase